MRKSYLIICCWLTSMLMAGCAAIGSTSVDGNVEKKIIPAQSADRKTADPAAQWRKLDLSQYANANAVLLDDVEKVVYNSNGTSIRTDECWTLIRTEKGKIDYRTLTLHFNEFYEKKPEVVIEIIKPDGTVIKPALQQKISVESSQMQSNIYDPANKVLVVGIPGLETGDILYCKYTEETLRARMKDVWCTIALLQTNEPILHYSYTVSAPEKTPLVKIVVKDEVKGTLTRSEKKVGDRIIYSFEANNVPQVLPEPDMPPWYLHSMRILASTVPDWESVSRWYYNLCMPHIKAVSPELTAKAKSLAAGKSEKAAIRAMFDFVSKEIRYTGVTNENTAPGYEPHDVKDTFAQKHGVCRDKAALLAAMLLEVGFDAFPVLFMAGDPKDPEVPNNYFNHAITGVKTTDGELILMDPTDENSVDMLPGYAMDKSFLCATEDGDVLRRSPVKPAEENLLHISSQGVLSEDFTLKMTSKLTFNGVNDTIYRSAFARWPANYREQFAAAAVKRALPGAVLEKFEVLPADVRDLSRALELVITYSVKDFVNIKWGAGTLALPFIGGEFGVFNFFVSDKLLKTRKYPMRFESTAGIRETCRIDLVPSLKCIALPGWKNINTAALSALYSADLKGNTVSAQRNIELKRVEVAAGEYDSFMQAVGAMKNSDQNKIIVSRDFQADKNAFAQAQTVVLDTQSRVNISSLSDYTASVYKKVKILNYGGVKAFSELKLDCIENISLAEFTAAKVTLPDNRVINIDLKTVKVMDKSVSQQAPRYPAARQLILPLAGIVPGAIVEYSYSEKVSAPDGIDFVKILASFSPIEKGVLEINYPAKLENKFKLLLPQAGFPVSISYKDNCKIVTIKSNDIPMYKEEPFLPPVQLFAPLVGISSFDSSLYAAKLLAAFKKAALNTPEIAALAAEFKVKYPEMQERVRAIRDFVAENIRHAGLEITELGSGYITPADVTLREGYGNSIDRAVLLYALLQAAGISNISVVMTSNMPDLELARKKFLDLPQNWFDTALLRVALDGEEFYLGDTNEYAEIGSVAHENMLALALDNGELITVESSAGFVDEIRQIWQIVCQKDNSAEITRTYCYYGVGYEKIKGFFDRATPEEERQYWEQELAGDLVGSEIIEIKKELDKYPGVVVLKVKKPDFWKKSGSFVYFKLPESGAGRLLRTAGTRTLPYMQSRTVKHSARYEVDLLKDWEMCELAAGKFDLAIPGCESVVQLDCNIVNGNMLQAEEKVFFKPFYLESAGYGVVENIQKELSSPANRTILFKTSGK